MYYGWKRKYAGMGVAELRRLKQLEDENKRLKGLVADLTLGRQMLGDHKKVVKPARRQELVQFLRVGFRISERRACRVIPIGRASHRYWSQIKDQTALRIRLRDLALSRVRYGYRRLQVLPQREGWHVNHKRVYRLDRQEVRS